MTTISSTFILDEGLTAVNGTVMEHSQNKHTFYSTTIGKWFAVAPRNTAGWTIWRKDSDADNGWTDIGVGGAVIKADLTFHASVAWDDTNDKLWVVRSALASSKPKLHGLSLSAGVFSQDYEFFIANDANAIFTAGADATTGWSNASVISMALDSNNLPVLSSITGNATRQKGIFVGYCTAANYASITTGAWGSHRLESNTLPSSTDSACEIIAYTKSAVYYIAVCTAQADFDGAGNDRWGFYYVAESGIATLGNWANETMLTSAELSVDNHISCSVDGENIFIVAKSGSPNNNINLIKYTQGGTASHAMIDNGDQVPTVLSSRGTLIINSDDRLGYVFKQEKANTPYGNTYLKEFDLDAVDLQAEFDPDVNGTLAIDDPAATNALRDPVRCAHNVTAAMGAFPVLAFQDTTDVMYFATILSTPPINSTLNMLSTSTPDGSYSADIYDNTTKILIETRSVSFSGGNASELFSVPVSTELWVLIEGATPPTTGMAYIGVTE